MKRSRAARKPRQGEIELMQLLVQGPRALDSGPVGRCSNRGWIRYVGANEFSHAVYELTALGRACLDEHSHGAPVTKVQNNS